MIVESDIIRRVLSGEVDAFRYFIDTYKDMAFSIVMGMIQDESIAEDVVQTAFINAFKKLRQFKMKSKFSTWFYTIVVNETRMQLRKHKYNIQSLDDDNYNEIEPHEENAALLNLYRSDQKQMVKNALSMLSPRENLLMRLYYHNENSIEEIHKITGFTVSSIKTGLHRARQNFYLAFKKEYKGEIIGP